MMQAEPGKDIDAGVEKLWNKAVDRVIKAVNVQTVLTQSKMKEEYFANGFPGCVGVPSMLHNRSGALRNSIRVKPAEYHFGTVVGRLTLGTKYAAVHFGPTGSTITITPKTRQYLTIPLPAAQDAHGTARGAAQSGVFGSTFFARSKAGNLFIMGKLTYQRGEKAGQTKGNVVPLFLLKKSVTVPARIDPRHTLRELKPQYDAAIKEAWNG